MQRWQAAIPEIMTYQIFATASLILMTDRIVVPTGAKVNMR
jgi:hypothetical protein